MSTWYKWAKFWVRRKKGICVSLCLPLQSNFGTSDLIAIRTKNGCKAPIVKNRFIAIPRLLRPLALPLQLHHQKIQQMDSDYYPEYSFPSLHPKPSKRDLVTTVIERKQLKKRDQNKQSTAINTGDINQKLFTLDAIVVLSPQGLGPYLSMNVAIYSRLFCSHWFNKFQLESMTDSTCD